MRTSRSARANRIDRSAELFLAALVEALPGTRGLTVLNFRPEYRAEWMARSYYRQIPLAPLGAGDIDTMLADLLGSDPSLNGLPEMISERTAGNPFFIEELVQALVEAGNLEGQRGSYRLVRSVDHTAVPASVQAVLASRIDRLAERDKAVLQTASVIGREFSQPLVAAASGLAEAELEVALRELVAAEYLHEQALYPHPEYAFKHPLTREVAYGSQLGERRARAHAAVAQAIEQQSGERIEERAALVADHRERAGEPLVAAQWYARAAGWVGFNDPSAAVEHWRRVVQLTRALDGEDVDSLALTARLFILQLAWRLGIPEQVSGELFAEAKELAERREDLATLSLVLGAYGIMNGLRGDVNTYIELSLQALASARQTEDRALLVVVTGFVAYALHCGGRTVEVLDILEEAIRLCEDEPTLGAGIAVASPFAFAVSFRGFALLWLGRLDEAAASLERGMRLALEHGDVETAGWNHMWSQYLSDFLGDDVRASSHSRQSIAIADRIGDAFSRSWARATMGLSHLLREEWSQAADALEAALSLSRERQVALEGEAWWLAALTAAVAGCGDRSRARQLIAEAVELLAESESTLGAVVGRRLVAQAMLDLDGADAAREARSELELALALADECGYRCEQALATLELARLERLIGNPAGAMQHAEEARGIFGEIGADRRAEQVRQELEAGAV